VAYASARPDIDNPVSDGFSVKADRSRNQLEDYKAAVREHIETAIRVEPGVLVLYAVSEKDPTHIRVFEIYARTEAYRASRRRAPEAAARRLDVPRGRPACGPSSLIFVISEFTLGTVNLPYFTVRQNRTTPGGSFPEVVCRGRPCVVPIGCVMIQSRVRLQVRQARLGFSGLPLWALSI
jgi:quinol monooxygenase YgiN